jgi:hypothetical protein
MESNRYRIYNPITNEEKFQDVSELPLRPGTNTAGTPIQVRVNQYKVSQWPQRDVYLYDVSHIHHIEP